MKRKRIKGKQIELARIYMMQYKDKREYISLTLSISDILLPENVWNKNNSSAQVMDRKQNAQKLKMKNLEIEFANSSLEVTFIFCFVQTHYVTDKNVITGSEKRAALELTLFSQ